MIDYLISVPVIDNPGKSKTSARTVVGEYNDGVGDRVVIMEKGDSNVMDNYPTGRLIGAWGGDGLPIPTAWDVDGNVTERQAIHSDYYIFRPLGNEGGKATGHLDFTKWAGMPDRNLEVDDTDPGNVIVYKYPTTNMPFTIRLEHWYRDDAWPGWNWRATMIAEDPARAITARAIGVYHDSECTNYWYTTGAFVLKDGVYQTETPAGFAINQPERPDWNLALLLGASKEGFNTLPGNADTVELNFWSTNV